MIDALLLYTCTDVLERRACRVRGAFGYGNIVDCDVGHCAVLLKGYSQRRSTARFRSDKEAGKMPTEKMPTGKLPTGKLPTDTRCD